MILLHTLLHYYTFLIALLKEQNRKREIAQRRSLQVRLGERKLNKKNRKKLITNLQATSLFSDIQDDFIETLLNTMEHFFFDVGCKYSSERAAREWSTVV